MFSTLHEDTYDNILIPKWMEESVVPGSTWVRRFDDQKFIKTVIGDVQS